MDSPFTFTAQSGSSSCRRFIAFRILDIAERTVYRSQAIGTAGDSHPADGSVPLVSRIVRIEAADVCRSGAIAGGVIRHAEMERLEPSADAIARNVFHIRHTQG